MQRTHPARPNGSDGAALVAQAAAARAAVATAGIARSQTKEGAGRSKRALRFVGALRIVIRNGWNAEGGVVKSGSTQVTCTESEM
jgi:hypothetical protein